MKGTAVLKLGGELIENDEKLKAMGKAVARAARKAPLVVVHGGGREIDAALQQAGIPKRQVDGLRVTDAATLDVVVAVLAGSVNTKFVAAINAAGGRAVGLTGADVSVAPVKRAAPARVDERRAGRSGPGRPAHQLDQARARCRSVPRRLRAGRGIDRRRARTGSCST